MGLGSIVQVASSIGDGDIVDCCSHETWVWRICVLCGVVEEGRGEMM